MKKITFVCLTAMMMTVLSTFSLPVAVQARTMSEGTLKWDFESSDDIGYFNHDKRYVDANSGAWVKEYMPTTEDNSWKFRVLQADHSAITTAIKLENGGDKCLMVDGGADDQYKYLSVGTSVLLSDAELIPGMEYSISFDILGTSSSYDKAYIAFSKPSAYITDDTTSSINDRIPWNKENMGTSIDLAVGKADITNSKWTKKTATFTAPGQYYENGFVRLHIAVANMNKGQKGGDIYIDNIEISPVETVSDKVVYSKVQFGKTWDFEEGANHIGNGELRNVKNYIGTYADGAWAGLDDRLVPGTNGSYIPKYIPTNKTVLHRPTGTTTDFGHHGAVAPGSDECIAIPSPENWSEGFVLGTKIKLSKADFPAGTYVLNLYAVSQVNYPANNLTWRNLNTSVFKGANFDVKTMKLSNVAPTATEVKNAFAVAKHTVDMGKLGNGWGRYNAEIMLTDDDYDENGYFTLVIHANSADFNTNVYTGEAIYLDDISLTRTDGTFPDGNVNLSVTSVSHSKLESAMTVAAVYADANLSALTGSDCEIGDINGVEHTQLKVNVPSGSTFKLFQFNANTLAPYLETPFVK